MARVVTAEAMTTAMAAVAATMAVTATAGVPVTKAVATTAVVAASNPLPVGMEDPLPPGQNAATALDKLKGRGFLVSNGTQ